jgi:glycerophosphoryl diester phosphodiesterase
MDKLGQQLKDKRGLSDASVKLYLRQIKTLNDNEEVKNLKFLNNIDATLKKLENYKPNTKKSYLSAIEAVLSVGRKSKVYEQYKELLEEMKKEYNEKDKNEPNDKEEKNWVEMETLQNKKNELLEKVPNKKSLTASQYKNLLKAFVLSLYIDLPPRRNQDYLLCFIVKKSKMADNKDVNYLDLENKKFMFNKYKTAKSGGTQEIDFKDNEEFNNVLNLYLKHHPLFKKTKGLVPLLVDYEGKPPTAQNWITRLLNATLKMKVGSSMLRKIYLTSKYGDQLEKLKDMKETAKKMGNSAPTIQNVYIKDV